MPKEYKHAGYKKNKNLYNRGRGDKEEKIKNR